MKTLVMFDDAHSSNDNSITHNDTRRETQESQQGQFHLQTGRNVPFTQRVVMDLRVCCVVDPDFPCPSCARRVRRERVFI